MEIREFLGRWKNRTTTYVNEGGVRSLLYSEAHQLACANENLLNKLMFRGENVALLASNSLEFVVAYWSLLFAGATVVLLDVKAAEDELVRQAQVSDCNWIVCEDQFSTVATEICQRIGCGLVSIHLDGLKRLCSPLFPKPNKQKSDIAVMCFTSGTTGKVRAVMLSQKNLAANTASHIESLKLRSDDATLIVLPLFYSYAHTSQLLCHTWLGGAVFLYNKPIFLPKLFCESVERCRPTVTSLVPSLLHILDQYSYIREHDLSSLKYVCCGGAPLSPEVARSFINKLPYTRLVHTYGLTEASPRVTTLGPEQDLRKIPSIGKPIPGVKVTVLGDDGEPVKPGDVGKLFVHGDNVMAGYYGAAHETQDVIKNGWLDTGDLAKSDEDGYLYLVGRSKNIIIVGAINVSPEEIENVLLTHPDINEVIVKGEYHRELGETPVAYVTLNKGSWLSLQQVHEFLRGKLAAWKWPKKLYICQAIEKTQTGKVRRNSDSKHALNQ